ncbi:MAG: tRNA-intron lyase [Zestosphaera tikiterensis]|uniref:tRNA-intron lyase n=1 Tax=Zestosphaera tikiterensis TaxID=1973259 RepID=A0A2R7Y723_9CREN|nr:MAG: tRNA-intron lyase [Zestosphaera tikiterensis]
MRQTFLRGWGQISGTSRYIGECPSGEAHLIGSKAVVFDVEVAKCLFEVGFFGKPLGVKKPKKYDLGRPLELSLVEAYYLQQKGVLAIVKDGVKLSQLEFEGLCEKLIPDFKELYEVYKELRDLGFVVRSALKYGSDFAIYRKAPGLEHAPYLVKVLKYDQVIDPGDLIGWGRLSHSVRKDLLLAILLPSGLKNYVLFKWFKP